MKKNIIRSLISGFYIISLVMITIIRFIYKIEIIDESAQIIIVLAFIIASGIGVFNLYINEGDTGIASLILAIIMILNVRSFMIVLPLLIGVIILAFKKIKLMYKVLSLSLCVIGLGLALLLYVYSTLFAPVKTEVLTIESPYDTSHSIKVIEVNHGNLGTDVAVYSNHQIDEMIVYGKMLGLYNHVDTIDWYTENQVLINQEKTSTWLITYD